MLGASTITTIKILRTRRHNHGCVLAASNNSLHRLRIQVCAPGASMCEEA